MSAELNSFKFLHAADLHLDSPLKGLELYEGAPVERIRSATRTAFENLVALAISERVQFVIIAGDLFDRSWTDIQTGLWTAQQFRILERENIPVYMLRGNHDAMSEVPSRITWPSNVHEFSVDQPMTFQIPELEVALHGQGYATREIPQDLTIHYPQAIPNYYNIGVLHTSLMGDPKHDTYAPTSVEILVLKGYHYWALGHIHQYQQHKESPCILYPGCTQGRHIQEAGAKGCMIVHVENQQTEIEFHAIDTLRWESVLINAKPDWELSDVYEAVTDELHARYESHAGRFLATRVTVSGACECHSQLKSALGAEEAIYEIRNIANSLNNVWIEKVIFQTSPLIDVSALRNGDDLIGEALREFQILKAGSDEQLLELAKELIPLGKKMGAELREAEIDLNNPENIRQWLSDAEAMVVSLLMTKA